MSADPERPMPLVPYQPKPQPEILLPPLRRGPRKVRWLLVGGAAALLVIALVAGSWLINRAGSGGTPPAGEEVAPGAAVDLEATVQARVALALTVEAAVQATLTPSPPLAALAITPSPTPAPPPTVPAASSAGNVAGDAADEAWQGFSLPTESLLNLRAGPGDGYDVLAILPEGLRLRPLGQSGDGTWLFISLGGESGDGWVAAWLLNFPEPADALADLPVVEAPPLPDPSPLAQAEVDPIPPVDEEGDAAQPEPFPDSPAATPDRGDPLTGDPSHPCLIAGYFWLISPVETGIHNQVSFRWGFSGEMPAGCGFEVRMWREGQPPAGVHDAVRDNLDGVIKLERQNEYRLDIPFIHNLPSVDGQPSFYQWTVAIVQISPAYQDFGREAPPARIFVNAR